MQCRLLLSAVVAVSMLLSHNAVAESNGSIDDWDPKVSVTGDARVDFIYQRINNDETTSGFYGKYLNLMVKGQFNDQISFSWKQRLNRFKDIDNDAFSATDWVYVTYKPTTNFAFSAGKQVVAVGGYEYDAPPIDVYFGSMFWNNFGCYQFGVSGSYISNSGNHTLTAQLCNSPFLGLSSSCYGYNLMWSGRMGRLSTLWSVNALEWAKGRFANYIALGNKLDFDVCYVEADLMNRHSSHQAFFLHDYSAIGKVCFSPSPSLDFFFKGGYEKYRPDFAERVTIDRAYYGGGFEFYPLKKRHDLLKLFAVGDLYHDRYARRYAEVHVGFKIFVDLFNK